MQEWLTGNQLGEFIYTMLMAMVPVVELRGAIPFGVVLGLPHWVSFAASVLGNILPVPFIVVFIRRIFKFLRRHLPRLNTTLDALEQKAHIKGRKVRRYRYLGLLLFVAIPLPGTGAWTGALIAAFLDMRLKSALPAIFMGVVVAGVLVTMLTYGVTSIL